MNINVTTPDEWTRRVDLGSTGQINHKARQILTAMYFYWEEYNTVPEIAAKYRDCEIRISTLLATKINKATF